jgi:hypothetical protein
MFPAHKVTVEFATGPPPARTCPSMWLAAAAELIAPLASPSARTKPAIRALWDSDMLNFPLNYPVAQG